MIRKIKMKVYERGAEQTLAFLKNVVGKMFGQLKITGELEIDDGTFLVFGGNGIWVTECGVATVETSLDGQRPVTLPGFLIGTTAYRRNYPDGPDEYEPVEVSQCTNVYAAAKRIASLYFEDRVNCILQVLEESKLADELARHQDRRKAKRRSL